MKDAKGLLLILGGVIVLLFVASLAAQAQKGETNILSPYMHSTNTSPTPSGLQNLQKITIGNTAIAVEVANTESARAQGLSGITNLPTAQGMLFVFDHTNLSPSDARFWMKGMKISIDFIWIANGRVSEITPNVPAPAANTDDKNLIIYAPSKPIDYVLEVNAGFAMNNNIKAGDTVDLNF